MNYNKEIRKYRCAILAYILIIISNVVFDVLRSLYVGLGWVNVIYGLLYIWWIYSIIKLYNVILALKEKRFLEKHFLYTENLPLPNTNKDESDNQRTGTPERPQSGQIR
jgi:hypothetical protein